MHPAGSIILFTTASGLGYGLMTVAGLLAVFGMLPKTSAMGAAVMGLAIGTVSIGLLSSTFHLGHPERAWRAVTQWRSSWLSREGVMALITFVPAGYFAAGWFFEEGAVEFWRLSGLLTAVLASVTVFCTAMIYASLKSVPRWHNRLVPVNYLLLALMSGAVWLSALMAVFGHQSRGLLIFAAAMVCAALWAKRAYWRQIDNPAQLVTSASATGLGKEGSVRLLEPPHTGRNYLLQEMGYQVARKHACRLRKIAYVLAYGVPLVVLLCALGVSAGYAAGLSVLAALSAQTGITVERWLFFAEAEHVVMLYYGRESMGAAPKTPVR